jgi:hypothetical protein
LQQIAAVENAVEITIKCKTGRDAHALRSRYLLEYQDATMFKSKDVLDPTHMALMGNSIKIEVADGN